MARSAATARIADVPAAKLRRIALEAQGLSRQAPFGRGRQATRRAIERIGYVQIDTISVVARAHDHVLHSRVPNYAPAHLDALQADGSIFEYWFHAAAYLPMRDYRYALPHMQRIRDGTERWIRSRDQKLMRRVLARVTAEGPLMARDFDTPPAGASGWWNWKPAKRALEQLFMQGDLMVTGRQGFQKTYDLTERVLPSGTDTRMPDDAEMAAYLLRTMLTAHGFVTPKSVTYQRRGAGLRTALKSLLEEAIVRNELVAIRLPGGDAAYADPERLETRAPTAAGRAVLLSPFDNLVIHRDRTRSVFGFDYQIECYMKEADRRFGYFCLPIVYRDRLVGRADCKAHREEGRFEIRHLHLETEETTEHEGFLAALSDATRRFAAFNGCSAVSVSRVSPGACAPSVRRALDG
jgi:hypothetical protein